MLNQHHKLDIVVYLNFLWGQSAELWHSAAEWRKEDINNWFGIGLKANSNWHRSEEIEDADRNVIEMIDLGLQIC